MSFVFSLLKICDIISILIKKVNKITFSFMPIEISILEMSFVLRLILAVFLGAVIGWQREHRGKSAGARTYAIVTAGSAIFTILSVYAFPNDIARVAASIVTGIGFLGAGMILHKEDRVEGLTTAAGLWIAAAIGMAVGVGFYLFAVSSTVITLIILVIDEAKWKSCPKK